MNCKERYLVIVRDVNGSKAELEHTISDAYHDGFIEACRIAFGNTYAGGILMAGDEMYFNTEHANRPMCGGIWLDWKPETGANDVTEKAIGRTYKGFAAHIRANRPALEAGMRPTLRFKYSQMGADGCSWYHMIDRLGFPILHYCQKKPYCENVADLLGMTAVFVEGESDESN